MKYRLTQTLALSAVLVVVAASNYTLDAQLSEGIRIEHAADKAIMAIAFQPKIIFESATDKDSVEELGDLFQELFGVDLLKTDQMYLQFSAKMGHQPHSEVPMFSIAAITDGGIDRENVLKGMFSQFTFEEIERGKLTYWKSTEIGDGPCFWFPNEDSVILSMSEGIESLIDNDDKSTSPEIFSTIDSDFDVAGFIDFENNSDGLEATLEEFFSGLGIDDFDDLKKIQDGHFRVKVRAKTAIEIFVRTNSEDDAKSVAQSCEAIISSCNENFDSSRIEFEDGTEQKYFKGLMTIFDNARVAVDGKQVSITVEHEDGLTESLDGFLGMFLFGLRQISQFR